jgi:uncharacterized PurR-regulated membrane protein YhhQ (DUF165 family)
MQVVKISIYLAAFVLANFIVLWFGRTGLIFTALFLIPFDFVMRCIFHENWKGTELFFKLGSVVFIASSLTYLINVNTQSIALGSAFGFIFAQLFAGVFYQLFISKPYWLKVNGSDAVGILVDSIVFQYVAFGSVFCDITAGQFILKLAGGIFWYWVIFAKYRLQDKI